MTEAEKTLRKLSDVQIESGKLLIVDQVLGEGGATLDLPETGVYPIYHLEADGMTFIAIRTGYVAPSATNTWAERCQEEADRLKYDAAIEDENDDSDD